MTAKHGCPFAFHSVIADAIWASSELLIKDAYFERSRLSTDTKKKENNLRRWYCDNKQEHSI